jgi:hypothetical protein
MGYQRVCLVMFLDGEDQDYWLMGDAFLRAYLTIYDRTNNNIGFVGNLKVDDSEDFWTGYMTVILIGAATAILVIMIAMIGCCCYYGVKHSKKKAENQ